MGPKKEKSTIPGNILKVYDELISTNPKIERKGVAMPYTSLNGHMFSFLSVDGIMGLRLPKEEREIFLEKYKAGLFVTQGTVLKEYVTIPGKLLKDPKALKKYFDISYEYVKSLKPKPTKNKSK